VGDDVTKPSRANALHDYGLSIVLSVLFVVTLVGAAISGWFEYASQQAAHGQPATIGGEDGYLPVLLEQVFQNWQSEVLALALLIVLATVLIHRGSPESKDGHAEKARRIAEVEQRIDRLVAARTGTEEAR
jgi:uncharacterized membrane protein YhaH (DUF805 family)